MKKISIIITLWNEEHYIAKAIKKVIEQDYSNIELIIVNDGSADGSEKVIKSYEKEIAENGIELKYIYQENAGMGQAFANGLKECTGDYLYCQDADDWLEPGALKNLAKVLDNDPDVAMVRGAVNMVNEKDLHVVTKTGEHIGEDNLFRKYFFEKDSYCFGGIFLVRMSVVRERIPNLEMYAPRAGQHWQIILPVSYKNKCITIKDVVYNCLERQESYGRKKQSFRGVIERCNEHKKILKNTIKRIPVISPLGKLYYYICIDFKYFKKKTKILIKTIIKKIIRR